ncbi:hypothetical protein IHV09_14350 [Fictibacillus sp. 23RED33]|nr:hypothetical protein [Fictibacillus sp. 23RED33]MBH0174745.1 hypothetical protein [Fictibacillus sp. 23RED33]
MNDINVKAFFSELHTRMLTVCLDLQEDNCTSDEAIQEILRIAEEMKMWL